MEYQTITNILDNTKNHLSKLRTKNCVERNDDSRTTYNSNSQIKFKTSMLKSSLCDYSDTYILVSRTITIPNKGAAANPNNRRNLRIQNCYPSTDCISEISNTQIDNAKEIDVVIPMRNLI